MSAVVQLSPVDTSLTSNPDYGQMTEYLITGTYYIVDNAIKMVYEFTNNTPGNPLQITNASYGQFQAYLASQAPIAVVANPTSYPNTNLIPNEAVVLLRGILLCLIEQTTEGKHADPTDFYPILQQLA